MDQDLENIVQTALDAGRELARQVSHSPLPNGVPFVILRNKSGEERLEYIDQQFEQPARKVAHVLLNDEASFLSYWATHALSGFSTIYGSISPAKFVAVLNDHSKEEADWRDHRASYILTYSREWNEWNKLSGVKFESPIKFAEWLENHVPDIIEPDGARMLEIAINLRVTQNAAYNNAVRLSDGNAQFTYTNIVDGQSRAGGGEVKIPEIFVIQIPVFEGLDAASYRLEARLRYRLSGSALSLWYELVRPHKVVEEAFKDILNRIQAAAGTKVLFGSPE